MFLRKFLKVYLGLLAIYLVVQVALIFPYLKQRSSARWIEKQGGWVRTESAPWLQKLSEKLPTRVQNVLEPPEDGYDWWNPFHEVTWVDVDGIEMTDDDLLRLNDFPRLDVARLNNANITGECFKDIRPLEKVGTVTLQGSSVTDAALAHLPDVFPKASTVYLCRTDITDVSIEHLEKMPKLWSLSVDRTGMSVEGVERIRAIPSVSTVTSVDGGVFINLPNGETMIMKP
ncbi:MAG: hypothetical protein ACPG4K_05800 [Haloferula sp.]